MIGNKFNICFIASPLSGEGESMQKIEEIDTQTHIFNNVCSKLPMQSIFQYYPGRLNPHR